MTTGKISDIIGSLTTYRYNPAKSQEVIINAIEAASDGTISIVDTTSPFVASLEAAVCCACAAMEENAANTRKLYPIAAQTEEDLYIHMSDVDFVNRFATPAKARFTFLLRKDELLNALVYDTTTGISKVVIPRNTFITVANTVFSLQYPIEIRQMVHGGLQAVYDTATVSPLQNIETNVIELEERQSQDGVFLAFSVDMYQFSISSQVAPLNAATDFKTTFTLTDQYYYVRAYADKGNGNWVEILTTHTDQVYDVNTPTAVIKVVDNIVTVRIPQIYTSTGLLNSRIRLDYYQTKGAINMVLTEYNLNEFVITWKNFDIKDDTVFSAPVKSLKTTIAYAHYDVADGTNGLSFDALKTRVIENSLGEQQLPITNVQVRNKLEQNGYEIVTNIDNITNRVFLAVREIPTSNILSQNGTLVPSANGCVGTIQTTLNDIATNNNVIDNGASVTLTPKTLFKYSGGTYSVVGNSEYTAVTQLEPSNLAVVASRGTYLYTPNYYVIDTANNEIDVRPYYLDNPLVETKTFVLENDSTMLQVSTGAYGIHKTDSGFVLQVVTNSSDEFKALSDTSVFVQLAFTPKGEVDRAYLNGVLQGFDPDTNERIYTFDLGTTHYIDKEGYIAFKPFLMYTNEPRTTYANLKTQFDIIFSTSSTMPSTWVSNAVDSVLGKFLLPAQIHGITHEKLTLNLGDELDRLWAQARAAVSAIEYERYTSDIPLTYADNVYLTDLTGSMVTIDPTTHLPTVTISHHRGDPVLDNNENPVYRYRKGDVVLDTLGNPVVLSPRKKLFIIDLMLIEGVYWFATESSSIKYKNNLATTLVSWLKNDLEDINGLLIENTNLYFYPKTHLGQIKALIDNATVTTIEAAQSFVVELYVSDAVSRDETLKAKLTNSTVSQLLTTLNSDVISKDRLITALKEVYGDDVIAFDISGLGGYRGLEVITILDPTSRCTIKKKLVADADNTLSVKYDVICNFNRYSTTL